MSESANVDGVRVVHWNPHTYTFARFFGYGPRRNNFGDLLGPSLVRSLVESGSRRRGKRRRMLAVGSILHFARDGDVLWGTGRNGKIADHWHRFTSLDVRAVRGPLTGEYLRERGISVPEVYGDPGLLVGEMYPGLKHVEKTREVAIVPNLHDELSVPEKYRGLVISPTGDLSSVLYQIAACEKIVTSSLHGKVVADALGIPAQLVRVSSNEPSFKYDDYFAGIGHTPQKAETSFESGLAASPDVRDVSRYWSASDLVNAFPSDLWTR